MGSEGQVALCGLVNGMLKLVAPCCPVGMRGGGGLIEESGHPTKKKNKLRYYQFTSQPILLAEYPLNTKYRVIPFFKKSVRKAARVETTCHQFQIMTQQSEYNK